MRYLAVAVVLSLVLSLTLAPTTAAKQVQFPQDLYMGRYAPGDEIVELRTESSKTRYLGGGKFALTAYTGPIHYKDNYNNPNEQWKDIDLTIENGRITKAPYILEIDYAARTVTMTDKRTGSKVTLSPAVVNGKIPRQAPLSHLYRSKAVWASIDDNVDLQIEAFESGVRFGYILKSAVSLPEFKYNISRNGDGIFIRPSARDADGKEIPVQLEVSGNTLTERIDSRDLQGRRFPVTVDPTLTVYSSTSDGHLNIDGDIYSTLWEATTAGIVSTSSVYFFVGQYTFRYNIYRAFVFFDTSSIPSEATITAATLSLYGHYDYSNTDFYIVIQSGQPTYPRDPLVAGDYNKNYYSGNGGQFHTSGFTTSGYNNISLNSTGLGWIQKGTGAKTKLCLRSDRDISGIAPSGYEHVSVYSADYSGTDRDPKLYVEYTTVTPPSVTTGSATNVLTTSFTANGSITSTGGATVTRRGFCYMQGTTGDPTTANSVVYEDGSFGTGSYSLNVTGLSPGTSYRVRAYAVNSEGTGYGSTITVTTTNLLSVATLSATDVGAGTATMRGSITIGVYNATRRGFEYDVNSGTPYSYDWHEDGTFGSGTYSYNFTGAKGQVYYYRAYAVDQTGTYYGSEEKFLTLPDPPSSPSATVVSSSQINLSWTKGTGAATTVVRYSIYSYPTTPTSGEGGWEGTASSCSLTNLLPGVTYYISLWSKAEGGGLTAYSTTYVTVSATTLGQYAEDYPFATGVDFRENGGSSLSGTRLAFQIKPSSLVSSGFMSSSGSDTTFSFTDIPTEHMLTNISSATALAFVYPIDLSAYQVTSGTFHSGNTSASRDQHLLAQSGDYILIPHTSTLNITDELTLSCSFYYAGGSGEFVRKAGQYTLGVDSNKRPYITVYKSSTGYTATSPDALTPGNWYSLRGTYSSTSGYVRIYVNDTLKASTALTGSLDTTTNDLQVVNGISGMLDNVKVGSTSIANPTWVVNFDFEPSAFYASEQEKYTTVNQAASYAVYGTRLAAQTFTVTSTHNLTSVRLKLYRVGNPGNITVQLRTTSGGVPTDSVLMSVTLNSSFLTTSISGDWCIFYLNTPGTYAGYAPLSAGTQYAVVLSAPSGNASNYIVWVADGNGSYTGGKAYKNEGSWTVVSDTTDFLFVEQSDFLDNKVSGGPDALVNWWVPQSVSSYVYPVEQKACRRLERVYLPLPSAMCQRDRCHGVRVMTPQTYRSTASLLQWLSLLFPDVDEEMAITHMYAVLALFVSTGVGVAAAIITGGSALVGIAAAVISMLIGVQTGVLGLQWVFVFVIFAVTYYIASRSV